MDLKEIQNLIKFVAKAKVNEVKIERKDFKITINNLQKFLITIWIKKTKKNSSFL